MSSRARVLVVDDEPLKRITLQIELGEAGYDVVEAPDAESALAVLATQTVHAVVSDVRMPGMDGLALLERTRETNPDAVVILMTAYGAVEDAVRAIKRGAFDYITKPFETRALIPKLERALAQRPPAGDRPAAPDPSSGLPSALADVERGMILSALEHCRFNQARAAQRLGIPRTTLRDKMARYGIASA